MRHLLALQPDLKELGPGVHQSDNGRLVTYFVGDDNYYSHPSGDEACRRHILTSLMIEGHLRPVDLIASQKIPKRTVMNWLKQWRDQGPSSFFRQAHRPARDDRGKTPGM
ncbi:MAG: hypothetical protein RL303_1017 [Verrucomicrobiota bacterium]|jgi:hypothetical protein